MTMSESKSTYIKTPAFIGENVFYYCKQFSSPSEIGFVQQIDRITLNEYTYQGSLSFQSSERRLLLFLLTSFCYDKAL